MKTSQRIPVIDESEIQFRSLFEQSADAILIIENGIFTDCNQATVRMMRAANKEEFLALHPSKLSPEFQPDGRSSGEKADDMMRTALERGSNRFEWIHRRVDGTDFPVEVLLTPISTGDRQVIHTVWRDITERKNAEKALMESEAQFRSLFEQSADAILLIENGIFTDCNQATVQMMRAANKEEFLSLHPSKLSPEYQPDGRTSGEKADDMMRTALEKGNNRFEWIHRRVDGTDFPVEVLLTAISTGDRQVIHTVWRDITERKQLEQDIRDALERRSRQVQISTQVSQAIASATSLDELYQRVVKEVKEQFGYYHTQLLRYEAVQNAVLLVTGYGEIGAKMLAAGHSLPMGSGLIGTAAATGETVLRSVLENDSDWKPHPLLPETKGEIAVPIKLGEQILGVLDVQSSSADALGRDDQLLLEGLCGQIATAIEGTRLRQEMNERLEEINRLYHAMSHEGWHNYRDGQNIPTGFMFDQGSIKPVQEHELAEELFSTVSLVVPGGEVIGSLSVAEDGQRPLTAQEQNFLQEVSEQLALALESARLFEQTQTALSQVQQGETRLRTLIENAPEAIVVIDMATGLFTEPNENATKLYGLSREELVRVGPAQMSPSTQPDGRDSTEKALEKIGEAMQGGAPVFEWVHCNAQGDEIPCEVRLVRLPGDRPFVRASVTDITERKRNQEILAQRADQLETVAALSTTASTMLDPDKLLQAVVDLAQERFRLYHAHIYLADESWKTLLLAAGAGEIGRKMVAEEHAIPMDAEKSLVARAVRERQSVIANDVRSQPDFLPNPFLPETRAEMAVPMIAGDHVLGVFDVQSDDVNGFSKEDAAIYTTLASQVAVALQNARLYVEQAATVTQLRELDRLKSSFLANMSHELRTPLNSILGFADVMLEELDGPLTENMNTDLSLIQKNGQHLLHLINDVLDMAKIEAGAMNLEFEKFNLHDTIQEVASITSLHSSDKGIPLYIEADSDREVEIKADRTRLRQVMINLINNAMKFTDKGSVAIRVLCKDDHVLISVKDTGIGIPSSYLENVFQEFTQVDTSATRKVGGTGLGLPISRRLIEMHGGKIWAESTGIPGEGSTFFILLPIEAHETETELQTVK